MHSVEKDCIITTPGWTITNCSSHYSHPPHTQWRTGACRRRKVAPFARSSNSSSDTYSCLWCPRCDTLDNPLNCYPYLKRPIFHIKAAPGAIRERLSNKSVLQHFLYCGSYAQQKASNRRHRCVGSIQWRGSLCKHASCPLNIYMRVPLVTIPTGFSKAPAVTT